MTMWSYWRERFSPRLFVPAAILIALAAQGGSDLDPIRWTIASLLALLLLAQFRLWDDLADREHDRATHPERVLVCAIRVAPYVALCAALTIVNLLLAFASSGRAGAAALALVNTVAIAWYAWRPAHRPAASDLVLLAKYPAFVLVLADPSAWRSLNLWIAAFATYTAACAYEIWHDPPSHKAWN